MFLRSSIPKVPCRAYLSIDNRVISGIILPMKLRNIWVPVAAAALPLMAAGCADPERESTAHVSGFDHVVDVEIEEKTWEKVERDTTPPYANDGSIRNVRSQTEEYCVRVNNPYLGYNQETNDPVYMDIPDDFRCSFIGSFWSRCETPDDDTQHCEQRSRQVWDYEEHVWKTLGKCVVTPQASEMHYPKPRENTSCLEDWEMQPPKDERRYNKTVRHLIRASFTQGEEHHTTFIAIDPGEWNSLQYGDCVEIKGSSVDRQRFVGRCETPD